MVHLSGAADKAAADEDRLAELGYKQDLKREWSLIHNFGVSFSIISIITGITTLFQYGLTTGGPGVMSVGWIVVNFFTFFVGLGMAEIVSAVPTSGGPYFWAAVLASEEWGPFTAWITGWFNFLGQVAVTTGMSPSANYTSGSLIEKDEADISRNATDSTFHDSFGGANLISTLATVKGSYEPTPGKIIGIYAALLFSHAVINSFGVKLLKYLNNTSIILHSVGISCIAIAVLAKAPKLQSAKFVFATFNDSTGDPGWSHIASPAYVAIIGILLAQYTITGQLA
ncbi:hypothetical protein ABW20_dc0109256 [Dactylellina cionopaga]|nr:hypothetical protein ABW20_dc0109256 [Dactylellina cionopaga]